MSSSVRAVPNIVGADLRIEGDTVSIKNLTISDSELASYLSTKVGPEQVLLLLDLIDTAMQIQRMANTSADVKELNSVAKQVRQTMKTAGEEAFTNLENLIQDQADEKKPGALINLLKTKLIEQVISELDPAKETSPFHSISEQLITLLGKSAGEKATKDAYNLSREKGIDFEDLLDQLIQPEAEVHGARPHTPEATGISQREDGGHPGRRRGGRHGGTWGYPRSAPGGGSGARGA
jgi:hypothetical protein